MARKILYIIGGIIALLVIIAILLPFVIDANKYKPQIESAAQQALNRKVTLGNIQLAIFSGGVTVDNISIAEDPAFGSGSFLQAKSVGMTVEMMPLIFSRQVNVTGIEIDGPQVTLLRNASGVWNFSTLGTTGSSPSASASSPSPSSSSSPHITVQHIEIKKGKLTVGRTGPNPKLHEYEDLALTASDLSYTTEFPFQASVATPGKGTITITGRAGPLNQTDAAATRLNAGIEVDNLDLSQTGFIDPASGVSGIINFQGTLKSDGQTITSKGNLTATKLKLVPGGAPATEPVLLDYETDYLPKPQTGTLKQGDVHIGKAVGHMTGTFNNSGETPSLAMKMVGDAMPAPDLESVLPAVGVTLPSGASLTQGTMDADLTIGGSIDKLVITGPVKLSDAKLAGFNLGAKLGALSSFAGIPNGSDTVIQTFSTTVRVAPEGIRADNLNLVVAGIGSMTGSGTIDPKQNLDFKMVAKLSASNSPMGKVASFASGGQKGGGIPFKIQGTTSKPEFIPEVGAVAGDMLKGAASNVPGAGSLGKRLGSIKLP